MKLTPYTRYTRRQHRWTQTVQQYHCPTCNQIAGQPCTHGTHPTHQPRVSPHPRRPSPPPPPRPTMTHERCTADYDGHRCILTQNHTNTDHIAHHDEVTLIWAVHDELDAKRITP